MSILFCVLIGLPGRATYSNLGRYSDLNEKTYRRWYAKQVDFIEFNRVGIEQACPVGNEKIAALDCSFVPKAGKKTYGLGRFFDSKQGKAEQGLEISMLSVVDVNFNTAYHLSTRQTPNAFENKEETRIDWYLKHFLEDCRALPKEVRYVATDAFYSKQKFTLGILESGYHQIGKLRKDANLRYLYTGAKKPKGRPKYYDGKVVVGDLSRLEYVGEQQRVKVYSAIVHSIQLKTKIRIVYLVKGNTGALLFSTDTELDGMTLYRYYKARFQIEFLFRDAKQFTGLIDSQARSEAALHTHFNASFTALNLIKWQDRLQAPDRQPISVVSWKTRYFNALLIERIFSNFDLDLSLFKSHPQYQELCNFGAVV